ncbi:MAG: FAD-dependent oxidoreductase [Rhodospirillaceae bacterium]|nr:FAD-dependent oxidoreductase [Rhodospirillaceae bacterium]MBT4426433.1 FAD-dependent oxidoreductase [Rhodospirillaceae bacterium]MBT7292908.1 FAD-dependent oxidoreductase [Rhodospirillaceae bacterium]
MSARDAIFDILFEPVKIGPVTARNRFYQVPHCNGMGDQHPRGMAAMRGVKAEGGWAVVSTEEVSIDHHTDFSPGIEGKLWDAGDIPYHARMVDAVHAHGSLAAIELCQQGIACKNMDSREVPLAPSAQPLIVPSTLQARAMDLSDIRAVRASHRQSALLAKRAGYDIVYVYAGHDLSIAQHFLLSRYNKRSDEYGGSLENRARLLRELIEDTKNAVGDTCAVAVRFAVDELRGADGMEADGEAPEIIAMLAELPDLWDVNISDWDNDSQTARFAEEGYQEGFISFVKTLTTKPVVGVGRYTSPDHMASLIAKGTLDFIGAARPSIADPFLPKKIEEGRLEDIRECIGCNICVSGDMTYSRIRCTQNPTMGEEWRKGWHPERIAKSVSQDSVLIVGGGPAGLECARALGQRGYAVTLAEAGDALGGRILNESRLPGMASYQRVVEHRLAAFNKLPNVETYLASDLSAEQVIAFEARHIVLATGAAWRRDGVGCSRRTALPIAASVPAIFTPDDIFAGKIPGDGPVLVYDDERYIMAGLIAEKLARDGHAVTLMTPETMVSPWSENTLEQHAIQRRILEAGVTIMTARRLVALENGARHACIYTGQEAEIEAAAVVLVTSRLPNDSLWLDLQARAENALAPWQSLTRIGDALAPATVAHAIYAGHRYAREFDTQACEGAPYMRERVTV